MLWISQSLLKRTAFSNHAWKFSLGIRLLNRPAASVSFTNIIFVESLNDNCKSNKTSSRSIENDCEHLAKELFTNPLSFYANKALQLPLELYKYLTSKYPSLLWDLLDRRPTNYNLRIKKLVQLPSTKIVRYGLNSLKFTGTMLCNTHDKICQNDRQFRNRIKAWTWSSCFYLLCR